MPEQETASPREFTLQSLILETPSVQEPTDVAYEYCKQATGTDLQDTPVLLAMHGLGSDMQGGKIEKAKAWALENGHGFARFDYPGHGSSGGEMVEFTMSQALDAALHLMDKIIARPVVLTGSSTGGWLALLLAKARPEKVKGIVTIANACDYTEDLYWQKFSPQQQAEIKQKGFYEKRFPDGFGFKLGLCLFEDGRKHLLFDGRSQKAGLGDITCPARLLHGTADAAVPWQTSVRVAEELGGADVAANIIPHADHRFSEEQNKQTLLQALRDVYRTSQ